MVNVNIRTALLIIDMVNDFEFEGGKQLFEYTLPVAQRIAALKKKAKASKLPIIYVNDNFKNWQADFSDLVSFCLQKEKQGKDIVKMVVPKKGDYHILKPSYSGFYATPLHLLLEHLNIQTLILTGIAGNMCVQFTANDAFMHNYKLIIPSDCIASMERSANDIALKQMETILRAKICLSEYLVF